MGKSMEGGGRQVAAAVLLLEVMNGIGCQNQGVETGDAPFDQAVEDFESEAADLALKFRMATNAAADSYTVFKLQPGQTHMVDGPDPDQPLVLRDGVVSQCVENTGGAGVVCKEFLSAGSSRNGQTGENTVGVSGGGPISKLKVKAENDGAGEVELAAEGGVKKLVFDANGCALNVLGVANGMDLKGDTVGQTFLGKSVEAAERCRLVGDDTAEDLRLALSNTARAASFTRRGGMRGK